jgi:hypothetical protein
MTNSFGNEVEHVFFYLLKFIYFLIFLDYFYLFISKINLKKIKKYYFNIFLNKHFKNQALNDSRL